MLFNEVDFTAGLAAVQWRCRFSAFTRLHQSKKKEKKDDFISLRATRAWREGVVLLVDDTSSALHMSS